MSEFPIFSVVFSFHFHLIPFPLLYYMIRSLDHPSFSFNLRIEFNFLRLLHASRLHYMHP